MPPQYIVVDYVDNLCELSLKLFTMGVSYSHNSSKFYTPNLKTRLHKPLYTIIDHKNKKNTIFGAIKHIIYQFYLDCLICSVKYKARQYNKSERSKNKTILLIMGNELYNIPRAVEYRL